MNEKILQLDSQIADWYQKLDDAEFVKIMTNAYKMNCKPENEIATRGNIAESVIVSALVDSGYEIIDTHKKTASGDFIIRVNPNFVILVEIKNYDSPIPQSQIAKFERDIKKSNVNAGIMISLKRQIKREWKDYHIVHDTVPIIYLNTSDIKIIKIAITNLTHGIAKQETKTCDLSYLMNVKSKLENTRSNVNKQIDDINKEIDMFISTVSTLVPSITFLEYEKILTDSSLKVTRVSNYLSISVGEEIIYLFDGDQLTSTFMINVSMLVRVIKIFRNCSVLNENNCILEIKTPVQSVDDIFKLIDLIQ